MKKRLGICAAALIMLVLFCLVIVGGVIVVPPLMLVYLITDSDWIYSRVGNFGRALDQAANVVFMDGHPDETISSHAGRYYEAKYGNMYKLRPATNQDLVIPWQAVLTNWLTSKGESDHVYKAVEQWAVDAKIPL